MNDTDSSDFSDHPDSSDSLDSLHSDTPMDQQRLGDMYSQQRRAIAQAFDIPEELLADVRHPIVDGKAFVAALARDLALCVYPYLANEEYEYDSVSAYGHVRLKEEASESP